MPLLHHSGRAHTVVDYKRIRGTGQTRTTNGTSSTTAQANRQNARGTENGKSGPETAAPISPGGKYAHTQRTRARTREIHQERANPAPGAHEKRIMQTNAPAGRHILPMGSHTQQTVPTANNHRSPNIGDRRPTMETRIPLPTQMAQSSQALQRHIHDQHGREGLLRIRMEERPITTAPTTLVSDPRRTTRRRDHTAGGNVLQRTRRPERGPISRPTDGPGNVGGHEKRQSSAAEIHPAQPQQRPHVPQMEEMEAHRGAHVWNATHR